MLPPPLCDQGWEANSPVASGRENGPGVLRTWCRNSGGKEANGEASVKQRIFHYHGVLFEASRVTVSMLITYLVTRDRAS